MIFKVKKIFTEFGFELKIKDVLAKESRK